MAEVPVSVVLVALTVPPVAAGRVLAAVVSDQTASKWDASRLKPLAPGAKYDGVVKDVALLPIDRHGPHYHGYHPWQPDRVQGVWNTERPEDQEVVPDGAGVRLAAVVVHGLAVREALDQAVGVELGAECVHERVVAEVAVLLVREAPGAKGVHEQVVDVVGQFVALLVS